MMLDRTLVDSSISHVLERLILYKYVLLSLLLLLLLFVVSMEDQKLQVLLLLSLLS